MSHIVLSRKLRPRIFDDVIGQDVIVKSLRNSIIRNKIGHAYVFSGTRGVGKTSIARIFAKALSCKNRTENANPCLKCDSCIGIDQGSSLDYLEIDGASHNSVDDVREIISNVHTLPSSGDYKVYIIDEVHMLSISAFNALLKTLEEPPAHVVFVLATTEPEKLPKTVLSRCQRFDFKQVSPALLMDFIKSVAKKENIKFANDNQILKLCRYGKGSIRDTLSLLDQVLSFSENQNITDQVISTSLGLADDATIEELVHYILAGNDQDIVSKIDQLYVLNIPLEHIYIPVLDHLYGLITLNEDVQVDDQLISQQELIWIYEGLAKDVQSIELSSMADKLLSIAFLKYTKRRDFLSATPVAKKTPVKKKFDVEKFIDHLEKANPAIAAHLEHGNIKSYRWDKHEFDLEWSFSEKSMLFKERMNEDVNRNLLINELKSFLKDSLLEVRFQTIEDESVKSIAKLKEEEKEKEKIRLKDELKSHHAIKEAERIFSAQIDKIKIYD